MARLSRKELVSRGLDPSTLPPFSASDADGSIFEPFQQALSIQESFMLNQMPGRAEAGYPAATQDAFLTLRHTLCSVALTCERQRKARLGSLQALLPRFSMQDAAESEVLMFDVIAVAKQRQDDEDDDKLEDEEEAPLSKEKEEKKKYSGEEDGGGGGGGGRAAAAEQSSKKKANKKSSAAAVAAKCTKAAKEKKKGEKKKRAPKPILTVRYGYFTSASLSTAIPAMRTSMRLLPKGTQSAPFVSRVEEIRLLRQLLEQNAARLDPAFVEKAERDLPEGFRVSTLQPVTTRSTPKSQEELEQEDAACAACGKAKAKKVCSRCKETHYCSRECQTAHWKQHKKTCRNLDGASGKSSSGGDGGSGGARADAGVVSVDLSADTGLGGLSMATMSFSASTSQGMSEQSSGGNQKDDVMFIVKVQVHPGGYPRPGSPFNMMCYDKARKVNCQITEANCSPVTCRRLDGIIRRGGIANGLKGYFKAFLKKRKLKILSNEPLPLQPW